MRKQYKKRPYKKKSKGMQLERILKESWVRRKKRRRGLGTNASGNLTKDICPHLQLIR